MVLFLVLWKGQDDLWELGTWFCARGYVIWEWIAPPPFFGKGWRPLGLVLNMYNDMILYSSLYLWATVLWTGLGPECTFSFTSVGASLLFQAADLYFPPPNTCPYSCAPPHQCIGLRVWCVCMCVCVSEW